MFLASPFSPQVYLVHGARGGGRAGGRTAVAPLKDSWVNAETPFSFSSLLPPLSFTALAVAGGVEEEGAGRKGGGVGGGRGEGGGKGGEGGRAKGRPGAWSAVLGPPSLGPS